MRHRGARRLTVTVTEARFKADASLHAVLGDMTHPLVSVSSRKSRYPYSQVAPVSINEGIHPVGLKHLRIAHRVNQPPVIRSLPMVNTRHGTVTGIPPDIPHPASSRTSG